MNTSKIVLKLVFLFTIIMSPSVTMAGDWKSIQVKGTDGRTYGLHEAPDGSVWTDASAFKANNLDIDQTKYPAKDGVVQKSEATNECEIIGKIINYPKLRLPTIYEFEKNLIAHFDHNEGECIQIDGVRGLRLTDSGLAQMNEIFSGMVHWFWSSSITPYSYSETYLFDSYLGCAGNGVSRGSKLSIICVSR